jgi:hypothetical protein
LIAKTQNLSLTALDSTARGTTISDKLTFPNEPTSSTCTTSTSTTKWEEKVKLRHSGRRQALDGRQELVGGSLIPGRNWIDNG